MAAALQDHRLDVLVQRRHVGGVRGRPELALGARDEEMDALRLSLFRVLLGEAWEYDVEAAIDAAKGRGARSGEMMEAG